MHKLASIVVAAFCICSCNVVSNFIHDDEVVARFGNQKLYRAEVEKYVPDYVSPEDSARMVMQYIRSWASERLYTEVASEQLSKQEMDVTADLDAYRRAILRYRYEQRYVSDRLDTLVTLEQQEEFYNANKNDFMLERPIVKVRFVDIMKDSPYKDKVIKYISSEDYVPSDTLTMSSALRYIDRSDTWIDVMVLAKEFGLDWNTMLANLHGRLITVEPEGRGDLMVAYVCDIQESGLAPIEYCSSRINDLVVSARKHNLLENLEQELLDDALTKKKLVINQQ